MSPQSRSHKSGFVILKGFVLSQWLLTMLKVLKLPSFIHAFTKPFLVGKVKFDFIKTVF